MTRLDYARHYCARGWSVVPVPTREKGPRVNGWQNLRLKDETEIARYFQGAGNIGTILGTASGGLVDVDLDCPEALQFAPRLLPETNAIFGRSSKQHSHRLYRVSGAAPSLHFKDPITGDTLLELRADGGKQTVFPPSTHPSGERIEWACDGEPSTVDYVNLKTAASRLAARSLVARYLPGVSDAASLLMALDTADPRVAARVREWLNLPQTSLAHKSRLGLLENASTPSRPVIPDARPEYLLSSPTGQRLVDRDFRFWARYDLGDCVRQLRDQKKPDRSDLLYKKAIRLGVLIAAGHIDQAEVSDALYEASVCNGLVDENGKQDVLRNIERGVAYGATKAHEAASTQATLEGGQGKENSETNESHSSSNEAEGSEASSDKTDESQSTSDDVLIDELANLSMIAYAKRRKDAAKRLGIGVTTLDKVVERRRAKLEGDAEASPSFSHWTVEPSPEPVDGDSLILALVRRIRSHVVMSLEAALTVALWIMFAWSHEEAAIHSPILMVTSPEPDCGKTTLLGLVGFLVPRSLPSVGISPAALFRAIEKWRPTLIIDEADVVFAENEDLRAVVNSGWTRGQGVLRCEGDDHEPRLFPTFCPKAIGLKGRKLPDTTASRAIVIELKRKLAHETVADFRHIDDSELQGFRRQLSRWAIDNADALKEASPTLPHGFANRLAANWHPLLAIAEAAGGEWPEKAREAAATIAKLKATRDESIGIQLLSDIRAAFGGETDRLFSSTLVEKLTADPEGMWAGYNRGKPLTQKQLASRLRDYEIGSETIWIGDKSAKGYKRTAFEDVWKRYLRV